jgi:hypothetical protein
MTCAGNRTPMNRPGRKVKSLDDSYTSNSVIQSSIVIHKVAVWSQVYDNNGYILSFTKCVLNPSSTIIVGGWIRGRYIQCVTYMVIPFHSPTFTAHNVHVLLCAQRQPGQSNARIRSLRIEIDYTNANVQWKKPRRIRKIKLYKNTSPMKWKYFHWRQAFTPNDLQMHQHSLDHSYCKRETPLTKLKNSKSVMILMVRLSSTLKYG